MAANEDHSPKPGPNHPPYAEMIVAAIMALNEKTGSSRTAIAKYIDSTFSNLPSTHGALLTHHLHRLKETGELTMVKHSYKLSKSQISNSISPSSPISPSRGRGRPRKYPKLPSGIVAGTGGVISPPRSRGRPPKPRDPSAPVLPPRPRGRPPKDPSGSARPRKLKDPSAPPRPRGRPRKFTDPSAPLRPRKLKDPLSPGRPRGRPRKLLDSSGVVSPSRPRGRPPSSGVGSPPKPRGRPPKITLVAPVSAIAPPVVIGPVDGGATD